MHATKNICIHVNIYIYMCISYINIYIYVNRIDVMCICANYSAYLEMSQGLNGSEGPP